MEQEYYAPDYEQTPEQPDESNLYTENTEAQKPKKKLPLPLIIGAAVLALALVVGGIFVVRALIGGGSSDQTAIVVSRENEDGAGFIPLFDGSCIKIKEDVKIAAITKDKKHVIVLTNDGDLYVTDKDLSSKTRIADEVGSVYTLQNSGVIYRDDENVCYRFRFRDGEKTELGKDASFVNGPETLTTLYKCDGKIYLLTEKSDDAERIGSIDGSATMLAVSDDGKLAIWAATKSGESEQTIYVYENGEKAKIGTASGSPRAYFTKDQKLAIIYNSELLWMKQPGKDAVKVKLSASVNSNFFTTKGEFSDSNRSDAKYLYVLGSNDGVYCIDQDGSRDRVLTKVVQFVVANGFIVYLNEDGELYSAKINGAEVSKEIKIASDVNIVESAQDGEYIYYIRDYDSGTNTGVLYCNKVGTEKTKKVASDACCRSYSGGGGYIYAWYSLTGDAILFLKDAERIQNTYTTAGTLYTWSFGREKTVKIANDVINFAFSSGHVNDVDPSSFVYLKYISANSDGDILCDWFYYNGSDSNKFASDIVY